MVTLAIHAKFSSVNPFTGNSKQDVIRLDGPEGPGLEGGCGHLVIQVQD